MLKYKGYTGRVEFDDEEGLFHGKVLDLRDVITFRGMSVEELEREFRDSIEDYLEFCEERGEELDKPFSGRLSSGCRRTCTATCTCAPGRRARASTSGSRRSWSSSVKPALKGVLLTKNRRIIREVACEKVELSEEGLNELLDT